MNLIVIEEVDKNNKSTIIGVCEHDMIKADLMLLEYSPDYHVLDVKDVRENGIEYIYKIEVDKEIYTIIFRYFELNQL